jgi:hypothetical protein
MRESAIQLKLQVLRQQFTVLQELCRKYPEWLKQLLPAALEDLKRLVPELQELREAHAQDEPAVSPAGTRIRTVEALLAVQCTQLRAYSLKPRR